jgi:hypothetical protein
MRLVAILGLSSLGCAAALDDPRRGVELRPSTLSSSAQAARRALAACVAVPVAASGAVRRSGERRLARQEQPPHGALFCAAVVGELPPRGFGGPSAGLARTQVDAPRWILYPGLGWPRW